MLRNWQKMTLFLLKSTITATQLYPVMQNRFLVDSLLKIKRYIFLNKLSCPHCFVICFGIVKTVWCCPFHGWAGVGPYPSLTIPLLQGHTPLQDHTSSRAIPLGPYPLQGCNPPPPRLVASVAHTVDERALRILLECFLVRIAFTFCTLSQSATQTGSMVEFK